MSPLKITFHIFVLMGVTFAIGNFYLDNVSYLTDAGNHLNGWAAVVRALPVLAPASVLFGYFCGLFFTAALSAEHRAAKERYEINREKVRAEAKEFYKWEHERHEREIKGLKAAREQAAPRERAIRERELDVSNSEKRAEMLEAKLRQSQKVTEERATKGKEKMRVLSAQVNRMKGQIKRLKDEKKTYDRISGYDPGKAKCAPDPSKV